MPAEGSPPGSLAPSDWTVVAKSAGWTLGAAVLAAAGTALADTLIANTLPDLRDRGAIDAVLFTLLVTVIDAVRKAIRQWIIDSRIVVMLLVALTLFAPATGYADDVTIKAKGLTRGQSYELVYGVDGSIVLKAIHTVVVDVQPGPTPTPTPTPVPTPPVLTTRGTVIKDLASKATADKKREDTAILMGILYSEIGKKVRTGEVPLDKLAGILRDGTDRVLGLQGAPAEAWKATRDQIAFYLTQSLQEGPESCGKLLEEVAAGLEASVTPQFQAAIDREKLKQLIIQIIILILSNI